MIDGMLAFLVGAVAMLVAMTLVRVGYGLLAALRHVQQNEQRISDLSSRVAALETHATDQLIANYADFHGVTVVQTPSGDGVAISDGAQVRH